MSRNHDQSPRDLTISGVTLDDIETEISTRIRTCHEQCEGSSARSTLKFRARAQALAELLAWLRFQRKINPCPTA